MILVARFGIGGCEPATLEDVGNALGISRERARQLETDALALMREQGAARPTDVEALTAWAAERLGAKAASRGSLGWVLARTSDPAQRAALRRAHQQRTAQE